MNWVLLLVLLILGYNIIRGYRKGFCELYILWYRGS